MTTRYGRRRKFLTAVLFACAIITVPQLAHAQASNSIVGQQTAAVIQKYLTTARPTVVNYATRANQLKTFSQEAAPIGQQLLQTKQLAEKSHQDSTKALQTAASDLTKVETAGVIIPKMVALHTGLTQQVQAFRGQVVTANSSTFIGGEVYKHRRPAMARIVRSEGDYFQDVNDVSKQAQQFLRNLANEAGSLSRNLTQRATQFGFDHYLSATIQKLETYKTAMEMTSPLFNGLDHNGKTAFPTLPCFPDYFVLPFSDELVDIATLANTSDFPVTNQTESTFPKLMESQYLKGYYETDPVKGTPGMISSWGACIATRRNNITVLQADIERELKRGNIALAQSLDLQRLDLEHDLIIATIQLITVTHRRDQVKAIIESARTQVSNEQTDPLAWRKTVRAHTTDLIDAAKNFHSIFGAMHQLIGKTQLEFEGLLGIIDEETLKSRLGNIQKKMETYDFEGVERLLEQLQSVDENLDNMTVGILSGETPLELAISSYEQASKSKELFWTAEANSYAARLSAAQAALAKAQQNFDLSFALMRDAALKMTSFTTLSKDFDTRLKALNDSLISSRFNPIYSTISNTILTNANVTKLTPALKNAVNSSVRNVLARFDGLGTKAPASVCGRKACPKSNNKFVRSVDSAGKKTMPLLDSLVDQAVTPMLGTGMEQYLSDLERIRTEIQSSL